MIRRALLAAAVLASSFCGMTPAYAQTSARVDRPILSRFDLDTPTIVSTGDYIVTAVNLANGALTLAQQPDTPRNLLGAVNDSTPSVVAGTVTFVGTDVNGAALTETWNFATSLNFTGTKVFATLTSATVAGATVLGGGGDEVITVGVGSVVGYRYCVLADPLLTGTGGRIKTASAATQTVTAVSGTPFDLVAVGDQIQAVGVESAGGGTRTVTAKASGSSITVDRNIDLTATGGYAWMYRTLSCGYGDTAGWFKLMGYSHTVGFLIRQRTATGGIDLSLEIRQFAGAPIQVVSGNFTGVWVEGVGPVTGLMGNVWNIEEAAIEARVGLKFGTTDDASDTGAEQIDVTLSTEAKR